MPTILAYLDPGSGSLILQALLGGAAAIGVGAKLWMHRVRRVLRVKQQAEPVATGAATPAIGDETVAEPQAAPAATSDRAA